MSETAVWVDAAASDEIDEDDVKRFRHGDLCIAVFNLGGRFFATSDICTHAFAHLSDGYVDGETVECPLHQGLFHIPTGRPMSPPVTEPLKTYPTRVEGKRIYVQLNGA